MIGCSSNETLQQLYTAILQAVNHIQTHCLRRQGEVGRTFPSHTFPGMRGSEENFFLRKSAKKVVFFTAN